MYFLPMQQIHLGRTNLMASRIGFGALPIQRITTDEAGTILMAAHDAGVNFFDTARAYSDSEEKIGKALSPVRKNLIIATKSMARNGGALQSDIDLSLAKLKTDYIDIYQIHFADFIPTPESTDGLYAALTSARKAGKIRHIGITSHRLTVALEAAKSGLYDTVQFPLSCISTDDELRLIEVCKKYGVGLIAMKAMAGGLIRNVEAAFAFLWQYGNVVPIWGIQRKIELDQFLSLSKNPPSMDSTLFRAIETERKELAGDFCRGCGYCLPCPQEIPISTAARMSLFLRRAPSEQFLTPDWQKKMKLIENCTECGECAKRCPYGLDTPALLKRNLKDYQEFAPRHS